LQRPACSPVEAADRGDADLAFASRLHPTAAVAPGRRPIVGHGVLTQGDVVGKHPPRKQQPTRGLASVGALVRAPRGSERPRAGGVTGGPLEAAARPRRALAAASQVSADVIADDRFRRDGGCRPATASATRGSPPSARGARSDPPERRRPDRGLRRACDGRDEHRAGTNADCRSHEQAAPSPPPDPTRDTAPSIEERKQPRVAALPLKEPRRFRPE
jgi:hypothetical protein